MEVPDKSPTCLCIFLFFLYGIVRNLQPGSKNFISGVIVLHHLAVLLSEEINSVFRDVTEQC